MGRVFAIMSGKGGVGKSTISAALAELYARQGLKVTLVDGDVGLRCADLMLGLQDKVVYDLGDLAEKNCSPEQAMVHPQNNPNLSLLAAPQLMKPSELKGKMEKIVERLADRQDIVLLDAPAGIGRGLKNLLGPLGESVIVATPDDVSLRDAEKLGQFLSERGEMHPGIIFNRISRKLIKRGEMPPPRALAESLDMPLVGVLPDSPKIYRALLRHESALHSGDQQVIRALETIAARLLGEDTPVADYEPSAVWRFFVRGDERL